MGVKRVTTVLTAKFLMILFFTYVIGVYSSYHIMRYTTGAHDTSDTHNTEWEHGYSNDIPDITLAGSKFVIEKEPVRYIPSDVLPLSKPEEAAVSGKLVKGVQTSEGDYQGNGYDGTKLSNGQIIKKGEDVNQGVSRNKEAGIGITEKGLSETHNGALNKYVLDVIKTYRGGKYPYLLNNDYSNYNGVSVDLYYKGKLLLKAHPSGVKYTHCVGITFEVFFRAMQQRNRSLGLPIDDFNGMDWNELYDFMLTWYVAKGPKSKSNCAVAVEKYRLGHRITDLEKARPGDFIDISREDNTGHTAVFIDWIRKGGKIIGLKYWSSQGSTNGISYNKEYFNIRDENGSKYGNVRMDKIYIARVAP